MSVFWFDTTRGIVPNHLISQDVPEEVEGRALRVRRLTMYPVECVVRGYLSGSGWKEYRESGSVCGIELPSGLSESDQLPEPIFTPATKAELGEHDENIDFDRACEVVGSRPLMEELRRISIELYEHARTHAAGHGIIVADTKFEFGASSGAEIVLGDEVLTPDSSRFWPADEYAPGRGGSSTSSTSATGGHDRLGSSPRRRASRTRGSQHAGEVTGSYERITGEALIAADGRRDLSARIGARPGTLSPVAEQSD